MGLWIPSGYSAENGNGDRIIGLMDVCDGNGYKYGVIGQNTFKDYESVAQGVVMNIEDITEYLAFGSRSEDGTYYEVKMIFISPRADDAWVNRMGYKKGMWNMRADINMMGHRIINQG